MTILTMFDSANLTIDEIKDFLSSSDKIEFKSKGVNERNDWIQKVLMRHKYLSCLSD